MDETAEQAARVQDFRNRATYFVELNKVVPALFDISSSLARPLPNLLTFPVYAETNIDQFWVEQREYLTRIFADLDEFGNNKNVKSETVSQSKEAISILILEASYHMV